MNENKNKNKFIFYTYFELRGFNKEQVNKAIEKLNQKDKDFLLDYYCNDLSKNIVKAGVIQKDYSKINYIKKNKILPSLKASS